MISIAPISIPRTQFLSIMLSWNTPSNMVLLYYCSDTNCRCSNMNSFAISFGNSTASPTKSWLPTGLLLPLPLPLPGKPGMFVKRMISKTSRILASPSHLAPWRKMMSRSSRRRSQNTTAETRQTFLRPFGSSSLCRSLREI